MRQQARRSSWSARRSAGRRNRCRECCRAAWSTATPPSTSAAASRPPTRINDGPWRCSNVRLGCWRGRVVLVGVRSPRCAGPTGRPLRGTGRYPPMVPACDPATAAFSPVGGAAGGPRRRGGRGGIVRSVGDLGEGGAQLGARREAIHRAPGEQAMDQFGEAVRQRRAQPGEVGGIAIESGQRGVGVGLAEERNPAGEAFVQHETERVEIGATVELLAADLLGRQVLGGAHHHVGAGEVVAGVRRAPWRCRSRSAARDRRA